MKTNYIRIVDNGKPYVLAIDDTKLAGLFTESQIKMMREAKTIICNSHHGNKWVKCLNATAVDMEACTSEFLSEGNSGWAGK